jgi:ATP dependent DNA ligase C terminal region
MLKHACKAGLEGVVSKVRDSKYSSGRSNDWVKVTCAQRETLTIAGFALDGNKWDGLYIGRRKGADLVYAGKVDHGFDKESAKLLRARLTPLIRKTQPYSKRIAHRGIWVEPELLAEIEYRAKSAEGKCGIRFLKACAKIYELGPDRQVYSRCDWHHVCRRGACRCFSQAIYDGFLKKVPTLGCARSSERTIGRMKDEVCFARRNQPTRRSSLDWNARANLATPRASAKPN